MSDDFDAVKRLAEAHGMRQSAIETDLHEAWKRGDVASDNVAAFLAAQKQIRPHWFRTVAGNYVVLGSRYDASLADVQSWLTESE